MILAIVIETKFKIHVIKTKGNHLIVNAKQFLDVEQNNKNKKLRKEHYKTFPSSFVKACKQRTCLQDSRNEQQI